MWMNWNRAKSAFIIVMAFASLSGSAATDGHKNTGNLDSLNRSTNDWSGYKTAIDKLKAWAGKVEGDVQETSLVDSTVTIRRSKADLEKAAASVEKILEYRKHLASKACENDAMAIQIGAMLDHCMGKALVRAMDTSDQSFSFSYPEWSACRVAIPEVLKAMQEKVPSENRSTFAAAWTAKLEMEELSRIFWGDSVSASGDSVQGSEDEQNWKKKVEEAKSKALSAIESKKWKEFCNWSDTTTTPNSGTEGSPTTSEYKPKGEVPQRDDGGGKPKQITQTENGGYGGSQYFPGQAAPIGAGAGYQTPPNNYDPLKGLAGLYTPPPTPYVPPIAAPASGDAGSSSPPPPPPPAPLPPPLPPGGVGVGVQVPPKYPPPPPPPYLPPPVPYVPPPPPPAYAEVPPPPPDLFKFKLNITASPSPSPSVNPLGNSMAMLNPMMMCMQMPPQVRMMNPVCLQMQQPSCPNPSICGGYPQPLPAGAIPGITTVASIQPLPTTPPVTGYPTYPSQPVPGGYPSTSLTSLGQNPYATPSLGVGTITPPTTFGTGTMGTTYPSLTPFGQPATQTLPTV